MVKMYVANCTNQTQDFRYRVPERKGAPLRIEIPQGAQRLLPGVERTVDVEAVVQQHTKYGMVEVGEIDRAKPFIGTCYSLDKPVNMDRVMSAFEHNTGILNARGERIRSEASVAINNQLEKDVQPLRGFVENFEVTVEEVPPKDGTGSADPMSVGVRVDRSAPPSGSGGGQSAAPRTRSSRSGGGRKRATG